MAQTAGVPRSRMLRIILDRVSQADSRVPVGPGTPTQATPGLQPAALAEPALLRAFRDWLERQL